LDPLDIEKLDADRDINGLIHAMKDPVPEVRGYEVNALEEIGFEGNARVIRPLKEALWD